MQGPCLLKTAKYRRFSAGLYSAQHPAGARARKPIRYAPQAQIKDRGRYDDQRDQNLHGVSGSILTDVSKGERVMDTSTVQIVAAVAAIALIGIVMMRPRQEKH